VVNANVRAIAKQMQYTYKILLL